MLEMFDIIYDIRSRLCVLESVTLVYTPREANSMADNMAKRGADLGGERVYWSVQ